MKSELIIPTLASSTRRRLGIGLFYLARSYASDPPINPATQGGVTNTHMKGSLWRETWERLFQDGYGTYNFDFLDACFDASEAHHKYSALQIEPGINSPPGFFDLPDAKQIIAGADLLPSTVPFDPVFLSEWTEVQLALATRYKHRSSLKFVKIQGPGIASESFFAITPDEQAQADALADELDYSDKFEAWLDGVSSLIDMYASIWSPIPIQLVTGPPYGTLAGSTALLQSAFDYGDLHHRGQFAAVAHDLNSVSPHVGEISQTEISALSPHSTATGYQFGNAQNQNDPNPPTRLNTALNRGTGFGAHEIEVFSSDADDSISATVLDQANTRMLAV